MKLLPISRSCVLPLLVVLSVLGAALADEKAFAASHDNQDVWILSQKHDFIGKTIVYLSAKGVRLEIPSTGAVIVSRPPDWRVAVFNNRTHVFAETDLTSFRGTFSVTWGLFSGRGFDYVPVSKQGVDKLAGLPVNVYVSTEAFTNSVESEFSKGQTRGLTVKAMKDWINKSLPRADRAGVVMDRFYGFPLLAGVPVQLEYQKASGGRTKMLVTESAKCERANISFAPPAGYKRVSTCEQALRDELGEAGVGILIRELDRKGEFNLKDFAK